MNTKKGILGMPTPEDYGYNVSEAAGGNAVGFDRTRIIYGKYNIHCTVCEACLTHRMPGYGRDLHDDSVLVLCAGCRDELQQVPDDDQLIEAKIHEIYKRECQEGGRTCRLYLERLRLGHA